MYTNKIMFVYIILANISDSDSGSKKNLRLGNIYVIYNFAHAKNVFFRYIFTARFMK